MVYGHDALGCGWAVVEGTMRAHRVVMLAPAFDQDLGLSKRIKHLPIKQLVTKSGVEALHIPFVGKTVPRTVS